MQDEPGTGWIYRFNSINSTDYLMTRPNLGSAAPTKPLPDKPTTSNKTKAMNTTKITLRPVRMTEQVTNFLRIGLKPFLSRSVSSYHCCPQSRLAQCPGGGCQVSLSPSFSWLLFPALSAFVASIFHCRVWKSIHNRGCPLHLLASLALRSLSLSIW